MTLWLFLRRAAGGCRPALRLPASVWCRGDVLLALSARNKQDRIR